MLAEGQRELSSHVTRLRAQSLHETSDDESFKVLSAVARERAMLYEQAIVKDHLDQGLVVNRNLADGRAESLCDSLFFSSLRFTALHKLGWSDEANEAWSHVLLETYDRGRFIRHPKCRRKSASRDQIIGLTVALTQEPLQHRLELERILQIIERTGGSIDDGPFYVSRLSPGIGENLRQLAIARGWRPEHLPKVVRDGFSTVEFDTWMGTPGYVAHLSALMLWIELELIDQHPHLEVHSINGFMDDFAPDWAASFSAQRRAWVAAELYRADPDNLFFEYLNLRAAGALTKNARARLLEKLLAMPEFPVGRLPQNCDRHADYLWQRASIEYQGDGECRESFSGVDFLWMTALLVAE